MATILRDVEVKPGTTRMPEDRSLPRLFWPALLLVLGFVAWCVWLVAAVERERDLVSERVGWLGAAQALQKSLGRGEDIADGLAALRAETAAAGGGQAGQDALQAALQTDATVARQEALDRFVRSVRGETAELSQRLGQRWSALYVLTFAALLSVVTALALLVVATWRRRRAEALQLSLAEALAEVDQSRAEAEAANANKTAYVTHMSHELRTPLNAILGYTALLREMPAMISDRECAGDLERVALAGEHMLSLINAILDIARIEAGRLELKLAPFEPAALADSVAALLAGQAGPEVALRVVLAPDLPARLRGDAGRIRQVLVNLLANALRFTTRGSVALDVRYTAGELQVAVEDTGPGISDADMARLFQPFSQVGVGDGRGSGIGLALCKQLVEAMNGHIGVDSEPGRGSRFHFAVPLPAA